jgi:hypothetical protein
VKITLPTPERKLASYDLVNEAARVPSSGAKPQSRVLFSAAHVVSDPLADLSPGDSPCLDWDATLAYRRHLWGLGLSVAEAMDTAQRGNGLDWAASQELIRQSLAEARAVSGGIACGAGTDHISPVAATRESIIAAYEEQCGFIESHGGRIILMASRALAANAIGHADYRHVYGRILHQVREPVILHWLGEAFDPALKGYWGSDSVHDAMRVCLEIIAEHAPKVDGIKISLLNAEHEITMRRQLPPGVRMYTGDDFNYDTLILGDEQGYSDALLGIFDPLAAVAAAAVRALDAGDTATYRELLGPTVALSRHIFRKPTYLYKTGIVFLAYLNGHQNHFRMVGAQESARSITHLAELFRLADRAGILSNPELAVQRMRLILALAGIS